MSDHSPRDQSSTRRSWHTAQNARNAMLTELLGFVPQLLLDDLADAATDTVNNGIDGLEVYLRNEWLPKRPQQPPPEELEAEIENGLLEFHTLLCGHRDMSIDMLETWSMRNVFHVPPELKVVMPHQRGLDLATAQGKDVQMQVELDVMRRKIENARRFQMQLKQAEEVMQHRLERSVTRLERIKELQELDPKQVEQLPTKLRTLHSTISSLPNSTPPPPTFSTSTSSKKHTESRAEFLDWAVKRLVTTSPSGPSGELSELAKDIQSDKQADDETRLVGPTNVAVSPKSSNPAPGSGDLSTIYETSFVGRPSDDAGTSVSLDVTGSEGSSLTHATTKRRRSSVLGGSKRRRSSLGLSERAKAIVSANLDRSAGNAEEE